MAFPDMSSESAADFDALMTKLAGEAERGSDRGERSDREERRVGTAERHTDSTQAWKTVMDGVQALARSVAANNTAVAAQTEHLKKLPELVEGLLESLEDRKAVTKRLFDALHEELQTYKDNFLFEAMQRPVVLDLLVLFDDLSRVHERFALTLNRYRQAAQGTAQVPGQGHALEDCLKDCTLLADNVDHVLHYLVEILHRLEVKKEEPQTGKLDKLVQKATMVEHTEEEAADNTIVRSLKPGFSWRGRLLRPEEVVIKKYRSEVPPTGDSDARNGNSLNQ